MNKEIDKHHNRFFPSFLFILVGLLSILSFIYRSKPPEIESLSKIQVNSALPISDKTRGSANVHFHKELAFLLPGQIKVKCRFNINHIFGKKYIENESRYKLLQTNLTQDSSKIFWVAPDPHTDGYSYKLWQFAILEDEEVNIIVNYKDIVKKEEMKKSIVSCGFGSIFLIVGILMLFDDN